MKIQKIFISVIVFNKNYVDAFLEYPFLTLKNNIEKLNSHEVTIYIETQKEHYNEFRDNCKTINHNNLKIIFKSNFVDKENLFSYSFLTNIQIHHIVEAKEKKYDFIFFTYGDMIYNNDCFKNALNKIIDSKKVSILSFALLIKKNYQLDIFANKMLKDNHHLDYLIENKIMINSFHEIFSSSSFSYNKSFIYEFTDKNIFLKALHTHPVCLNLNIKINKNKLLNAIDKALSLDNGFIELISSDKSDYLIEEDLNKISIFTYDNFKKERFFVNFDKFFNYDKNIIEAGNYIFFDYFFKKASNIKQHFFQNFTMKYKNENPLRLTEYNQMNKNIYDEKFEIFMDYVKKSINEPKLIFILRVLHPLHMIIIFLLVIMSKLPVLTEIKASYTQYYFQKHRSYLTPNRKKDFLYHSCRRLFLSNPKNFISYFYSKY
jgi:hypothetical protein